MRPSVCYNREHTLRFRACGRQYDSSSTNPRSETKASETEPLSGFARFPAGTLHANFESPATTAYMESFLDDGRAPTATRIEAVAALSGRELSVVVRNQRLLKSHFAPRRLRAPTWITLHAELEVDHFLDILRPILPQASADSAVPEAIRSAIERGIRGHAEYLDALFQEHEAEAARSQASDR